MIIKIPFEPGFRRTTGPVIEVVRLPISIGYARGANVFVAAMSGCVAVLLTTAIILAAIRAPSLCATYWDVAIMSLTLFLSAIWATWHVIIAMAFLRFALTKKAAIHIREDKIAIERFRDPIFLSDVLAVDLSHGSILLSVKLMPYRKSVNLIVRLFNFCLEMGAYAQSRRKLEASEVRVAYGHLELRPWALKCVISTLAKVRT